MYGVACLAASVDGKITAPPGTASERVKLGTPEDLNRLFTLRHRADVICMGASTFREWPIVRWPGGVAPKQKTAPPIHVIFTESGNLPWEAPLFQQWQTHWPPICIVSPKVGIAPPDSLKRVIQIVHTSGSPQAQMAHLEHTLIHTQAGYPQRPKPATWLIEGGGELMAFFLEAQAIHELHLTITPQLIGGLHTPGLVGGKGFSPQAWPLVTWQEVKPLGSELHCVGNVTYSQVN
jgi:riboflavin biosynthesis pyrimidine reductase